MLLFFSPPVPSTELYELQNGQISILEDTSGGPWGGGLAVAGQYAVWYNEPNLILRDLTTGTNTTISSTADVLVQPAPQTQPFYEYTNAVASNGDVVWTGANDYQIYRSRGGIQSQLTSDSYGHFNPLTDGINVVYFKSHPVYVNESGAPYSTALFGAAGEVILDPDDPYQGAYQVNGGWTAYTAPSGGAYQVFLLDPSGDKHQLTEFSSDAGIMPPDIGIAALDSSGGVMLFAGGRRYFASPTVAPIYIAGSAGTAVSIGGAWYLMSGPSLFSLPTGADGGLPDAGACGSVAGDAGSGDQTRDDSGANDGSSNDDTIEDASGGVAAGNASDAGSGASAANDGSSSDATVADAQGSPASGSPGSASDASDDQTVAASKSASGSGGSQGSGCSVSAAGQPLRSPWGSVVAWASVLLIVRRRRGRPATRRATSWGAGAASSRPERPRLM